MAKLAELLRRPEWHASAGCRGIDCSTMFPDNADEEAAAKGICFNCGVRPDCLAYALLRREPDGVWGGFTTRERTEIIKADPEKIAVLFQFVSERSSAAG